MYYVVPTKAANAKLGEDFIALATSPKVQADGIVRRFNWYPGIDAAAVRAQLDEASWNKLFVDVTPEDLATKGKPFPIAAYFNDILESYERQVQKTALYEHGDVEHVSSVLAGYDAAGRACCGC